MTYETFLEKLRQTPRIWELRRGHIRCGNACPITVVCGNSDSSVLAGSIALAVGMHKAVARSIIFAADNQPGWELERADLLAACGLAQPSPDGGERTV